MCLEQCFDKIRKGFPERESPTRVGRKSENIVHEASKFSDRTEQCFVVSDYIFLIQIVPEVASDRGANVIKCNDE